MAVRFSETLISHAVPKFGSEDFSVIVRDTFILCASKRLNGQPSYVAQILKDCNADT